MIAIPGIMKKVFAFLPLKGWIALTLTAVVALKAGHVFGVSAGREELARELAAQPPKVTTVTEIIHDTLKSPPIFRYIRGEVIVETVKVDLSAMTRKQLEEAVQPYAIVQPVTVGNDSVSVSFRMSAIARPLNHSLESLSFHDVYTTYPRTTVTIEKYIPQPEKSLFFLFARGQIAGYWKNKISHSNVGGFDVGLGMNIGQARLSISPMGRGWIGGKSDWTRSLTLEFTTE